MNVNIEELLKNKIITLEYLDLTKDEMVKKEFSAFEEVVTFIHLETSIFGHCLVKDVKILNKESNET